MNICSVPCLIACEPCVSLAMMHDGRMDASGLCLPNAELNGCTPADGVAGSVSKVLVRQMMFMIAVCVTAKHMIFFMTN